MRPFSAFTAKEMYPILCLTKACHISLDIAKNHARPVVGETIYVTFQGIGPSGQNSTMISFLYVTHRVVRLSPKQSHQLIIN